ncbi:MAG: GNAT family N-acetyltransferase [Christensenellales bacterium]|jgi:hypothetical protein
MSLGGRGSGGGKCPPPVKSDFGEYADRLFAILADNMSKIAPTGNTREEDYKTWNEAVGEGLQSESRQIVLITDEGDERVIGFFQYYANEDTFMMEEVQIAAEYQGVNNIFRNLYRFVFANLHANIVFVEAYANKLNHKSGGILKRMGLKAVGANNSGTCIHYRGKYCDLLRWHSGKSQDWAREWT